MLANYVKTKFKGLKDLVNHIRNASAAAVMRMFTQRKSRYDDVLSRMASFNNVVQASGVNEIDVSDGIGKGKKADGRIDGKSLRTVRFQDGTSLPIMDFQVPNRQQLGKDVKMLDEADQYIEEIEEMKSRLGNKKDAATRKFLREMNAYLKKLTEQRDQLLDTIEELTDRHAPSTLTKLGAALQKHVNATLPAEAYSELGWEMYISSHHAVVGKKNAPIEFTCYLHMDDLNKDMFKSDGLILVLTGEIHEVKGKGRAKSKFYMNLFLTAIPKFMVPGSFKPGTRLTGNSLSALESSMKREATKLISMHSVMPSVGRRKIGVTQQQLRHTGIIDLDGVIDIDVDEDENEIMVELTNISEDVIRAELWPEIVVHLRKVIRAPKKSAFVYNLEKDGRKRIMRIANVKNVADN